MSASCCNCWMCLLLRHSSSSCYILSSSCCSLSFSASISALIARIFFLLMYLPPPLRPVLLVIPLLQLIWETSSLFVTADSLLSRRTSFRASDVRYFRASADKLLFYDMTDVCDGDLDRLRFFFRIGLRSLKRGWVKSTKSSWWNKILKNRLATLIPKKSLSPSL